MSYLRFSLVFLLAVSAPLFFTACRTTPPPPPKPAVTPTPTPTPQPLLPPSATMSLRDYLKQQLGENFHTREEWAGTDGSYAPQPYGDRVWGPIGEVQYVTVHHAEMRPWIDTAAMIRAIFRDHTSPGGRLDAADVGYHFFVDYRGQVWEGRDATRIGTHVGSRPPGLNNPHNLGICGLGSFLYEEPPQVVLDQVVNVAALIGKYYGRPMTVRGHHDWSGVNGEPDGCTSCPGRLETAVSLSNEKMQAMFPGGVSPYGSVVAAGAAPATGSPAAVAPGVGTEVGAGVGTQPGASTLTTAPAGVGAFQ